jgi:hypothetical protein
MEGGFALDGHLRDDAQAAETDLGRREQLRFAGRAQVQNFTSSGDQPEADDLGGQIAKPEAGAVRAGGDGASYALLGDGAEIRQSQAAPEEQFGQVTQANASAHG